MTTKTDIPMMRYLDNAREDYVAAELARNAAQRQRYLRHVIDDLENAMAEARHELKQTYNTASATVAKGKMIP